MLMIKHPWTSSLAARQNKKRPLPYCTRASPPAYHEAQRAVGGLPERDALVGERGPAVGDGVHLAGDHAVGQGYRRAPRQRHAARRPVLRRPVAGELVLLRLLVLRVGWRVPGVQPVQLESRRQAVRWCGGHAGEARHTRQEQDLG